MCAYVHRDIHDIRCVNRSFVSKKLSSVCCLAKAATSTLTSFPLVSVQALGLFLAPNSQTHSHSLSLLFLCFSVQRLRQQLICIEDWTKAPTMAMMKAMSLQPHPKETGMQILECGAYFHANYTRSYLHTNVQIVKDIVSFSDSLKPQTKRRNSKHT